MDRRDFLRYALTVAAAAGVAGLPLPSAVPVEDEEAMIRRAGESLGRVLNIPTEEAVRQLAEGYKRSVRTIGENIGLTINMAEAQREYAEALGRLADSLTDHERMHAFMGAALRAGRERVKAGPPDAS